MAKKTGNEKDKIVFSTNSNFDFSSGKEGVSEAVPASQQTLYISLERLKGGKVATVIENFQGPVAELEDLGKQVKSKCGVGGTVKDGIILVQGEQREKVIAYLNLKGFRTKRKGG